LNHHNLSLPQILSATVYLLYLFPRSNSNDHPTYHRHSKYTTALFFLHTFSLITYPMPTLLYVLKHRHRLPPLPDLDPARTMILRIAELVTLLTAWIAVGTMRRGPELFFDAQRLSIGYGWAMEDKDDKTADKRKADRAVKKSVKGRVSGLGLRLGVAMRRRWWGKKGWSTDGEEVQTERRVAGGRLGHDEAGNGEDATLLGSSSTSPLADPQTGTPQSITEPQDTVQVVPAPNVLDYYQCSILSLLFIGYIWSVASIAARRPELRPEDLPHMPETLRAENVVLPPKFESGGERGRFVLTPEELEEKEWNEKQGDKRRGGAGVKRKVWTPWTLLREVCRGQAWLILSCKSGSGYEFGIVRL
jgi:hypothetical protein